MICRRCFSKHNFHFSFKFGVVILKIIYFRLFLGQSQPFTHRMVIEGTAPFWRFPECWLCLNLTLNRSRASDFLPGLTAILRKGTVGIESGPHSILSIVFRGIGCVPRTHILLVHFQDHESLIEVLHIFRKFPSSNLTSSLELYSLTTSITDSICSAS